MFNHLNKYNYSIYRNDNKQGSYFKVANRNRDDIIIYIWNTYKDLNDLNCMNKNNNIIKL